MPNERLLWAGRRSSALPRDRTAPTRRRLANGRRASVGSRPCRHGGRRRVAGARDPRDVARDDGQFAHLAREAGAAGKGSELRSRVLPLRSHPHREFRRAQLFHPAMKILEGDAVHGLGRHANRSGRRRSLASDRVSPGGTGERLAHGESAQHCGEAPGDGKAHLRVIRRERRARTATLWKKNPSGCRAMANQQ